MGPLAAVVVPVEVPRELPGDLDRASRSRPRAVVPPSPKPVAAPKPVAQPAAKPAAKAAPKPSPTASRKPRVRTAAAKIFGGRCPVPAASFTDTYGAPRPGGRSHKGTDLLAPYGSPVYAVTGGVVDTTFSSNGGTSLYLRAANGERYFYAHNSENVAGDGQRVEAGQLIARVGSTGNAGDINHVHFEREVGGVSVNPYPFVRSLCG